MNSHPDRSHHLRPPWHRWARAAAAITVTTSAALLAAACGASGPHNAGGSPGSASGVAYSHCMRSHGVPNFPDPGSDGQIPKPAAITALRQVSDSLARSASSACENSNPAGQGSPALTAQQRQDYLRAATCMRAHGITSFPDPDFSGGNVSFPIPASFDTTSQQYTRARQACTRLIPAGLPDSGTGS